MKIGQFFKNKKTVFSIECFPPKQTSSFENMKAVLANMKSLSPDFISVTYGAGGSSGGISSGEIAQYIKKDLQIESVAHIVCMGSEKDEMQQIIGDLNQKGIENILALRGDESPYRKLSQSFKHASDLIAYIKTLGDFFISGACYPEGHPESKTITEDIDSLIIKQNNGCDHFFTQMFFDNSILYRFLNRSRKAGLCRYISAGIMPIVKSTQIERIIKLSSSSLPSELSKIISRYQNDDESLFKAGIDYAINQIRDLIDCGVDGIHLYAMNNFEVAKTVHAGIKDLL